MSKPKASVFKKSSHRSLSSGLTTTASESVPIVVSSSTTTPDIDKNTFTRNRKLKGGNSDKAYKIIFDSANSKKFLLEVEKMLKNPGSKVSIDVDNRLTDDNSFFILANPVKCRFMIDDNQVDGEVFGMDENNMVVVRTSGNKNYIVSFKNQMEISEDSDELDVETSEPEPESESEPVSETEPVSEPVSETEETEPETDTETEDTEPETESDITSSANNTTTESSYASPSSISASISTSVSSSISSTSGKSSSFRSSGISSGSSNQITSLSESSNRSDYVKNKQQVSSISNANMRGGSKNKQTKAHFMKAGKGDNVGIKESVKGYYSESTSIEEGLCE